MAQHKNTTRKEEIDAFRNECLFPIEMESEEEEIENHLVSISDNLMTKCIQKNLIIAPKSTENSERDEHSNEYELLREPKKIRAAQLFQEKLIQFVSLRHDQKQINKLEDCSMFVH